MNQRRRSRFSHRFIARRLRRALFRRAHTAARWASVGIYLFLSLGIQLPAPVAKKSDQPYPCMNHPCGCASAEQCWRHCCCTTLEQRLAWAREHHVRPPNYALAEARARGIDWDAFCAVGPEGESRICRDGEEVPPQSHPRECRDRQCADTHHRSSSHEDRPAAPPQGVVWIAAMFCQRGDVNWSGQIIALPPPEEARLSGPQNSSGLSSLSAELLSPISFAPPTPPPRSAAA
jgi:hypothetical protein